MDHGSRRHAAWSASASARNWACPGALALISSLGVEDRESRAAAWGTACHQVAEHCLRDGQDAADFIGRTVRTTSFAFEFDDEMAECTQTFLDYVKLRVEAYLNSDPNPDFWRNDAVLLVEQKFDLAPIDPPFEAGGTGDAVLLFPAWGLVEIVDLKTGMGFVDATENLQLRTYALGALIANRGPWRKVRATIVQPRVGDRPVRYEEIDVADLLDWTADLKDAMARCKGAIDGFASHGAGVEWSRDNLRPGPHCDKTFCPARASCPALEAKALAAAHTFFRPEGTIAVPPEPKGLSNEKVAAILDAADMIEGWLNAVRAEGRHRVESGLTVGDYILVPKRGTRKWKLADDEAALAGALQDVTEPLGIDHDSLYERKIKSPNQVEKILGAKRKGLIADLWATEVSGTNLVRSDKTTREAVTPPALQFFTKES